jgi:outer membrane protein OmpA-like peptidoglycan-associated protein
MRAEAVKKVLVKYGVKEENITATGMGDTVQPYSDNYMNRAVVFTTK